MTLTWQPVPGATSYNVYVGTSSFGEDYYANVTNSTIGLNVTGLTNDTAYYFLISEVAGSLQSGFSGEVSATPTGAPVGLTATPTNGQVTLMWQPVSGTTNYKIYMATNAGSETNSATVGLPESINFDVAGGAGGGAINYSGAGGYANSGTNYWNPFVLNGTTPAGTNSDGVTASPVTLTDTAPSNSNHGVSFGVAQGAQGTVAGLEAPYAYANNYTTGVTNTLKNVPAGTYNLYLYGKDGDNSPGANNGTLFTVSVGGVSYGSQSTANSVTSSFTKGNDYVVFSNVVVGAGGVITFSYRGDPAFEAYEGDFNGLQLVSFPSYTVTNLSDGTTYYFEVTTVNGSSHESDLSSEVSATPLVTPTGGPTGLTAIAGDGQVTLSWQPIAGAIGYNVYVGLDHDGEGYFYDDSTTTNSYTYEGLANGYTFYFEITAEYVSGESGYSSQASATPTLRINFDVPGGAGGGATNYSGAGGYANSGTNYWNPFVLNGTTPAGTNSDGVTASPVTLTDNSPSNSNHGVSFGVAQGAQGTVAGLEAPYAYANNYTTGVTNTLNNVPAGTYNLYLYGKDGDNSPGANNGTLFTVWVGGVSYGSQSTANSVTSSFTMGNDYVVFSNVVVGTGGVIAFSYRGNPGSEAYEGDFNGLQLVSVPPTLINFDVPGGAGGGATNYSGAGGYANSGTNYWNPFVLNGTTPAGTNSDGVTASPVTLTDNSPSNSNHGVSFGVAQGAQGTVAGLEAPYAYANNYTTGVTNTLNNVPAGTYNLYLYGKNGDSSFGANNGTLFTVWVGGVSYGSQSTANSVTSSFTEGNDYVVFYDVVVPPGVSAISFSYRGDSDSEAYEGDFNGLQLAVAPTLW